jgi:hypothetical protein
MNELYSETPYRMAREYHHNMLQKSKEAQLVHSAKPNTPKVWDYVALRLGNWLINLGCNLRSQSAFSQLSKKQA